MKWFLILLAIGLTASEKLDRTYLPPPGAQFAGGNPGDIQVPLEPPNFPKQGPIPTIPGQNVQQDFGQIGSTQSPVTTTSYAFTQTTTYPPVEGYETTLAPINPVTGLPVQNYQQYNPNLPDYSQNLGQTIPGYNINVQPGSPIQVSDGQPINIGSPNYVQPGHQYPGQIIVPGSGIQIPGSVPQQTVYNQGTQYPSGQNVGQISPQYFPGQNVVVPGTAVQIPGSGTQGSGIDQGLIQYGNNQPISGQQGSLPSTVSPYGIQTVKPGDQYVQGVPSGQGSQGTYNGQPINVQDGQPQYNQGQQNILGLVQPGSTVGPNIIAGQDGFSTPAPNFPSSTSAHSLVGSVHRPERPQAAADRNAVIISYENVRTPNGYSYSYDTSNGIHADETGTVGDGTKAQGSYSYIGDDGKLYSVVYTADENGFQPRGDHLPTPPPIPEAIKKVIEQAARDKEAGIIDDGSYDEGKYGYKQYQSHKNRRPQTHSGDKFDDYENTKTSRPKPIAGLFNDEYDENVPEDEFNEKIAIGDNKKRPIRPNSQRRPTNKIDYDGNNDKYPDGNRRVSDDSYEGLNNNNQGLKAKGSSGRVPTNDNNGQVSEQDYIDQQNEFDVNQRRPSGRRPVSGGKKGTKTRYPGTQIEDNQYVDSYPGNEDDLISEGYDNQDKDGLSFRPGDNLTVSNKDTQDVSNRKQSSKQKPKGSKRPGYIKGKRPQTDQIFNQGDIDDFDTNQSDIPSNKIYDQNNIKQAPNQETVQHIDENGYIYNAPQTGQNKFPTRFNAQDVSPTVSSMQQDRTKGTTLKPFMTPEVYNQGNEGFRQSTTRRPFMTTRVTTPKDDSYTDYDGEDYETDQDSGDEEVGSTSAPNRKDGTGSRRPYRPNQTTPRPQYTPSGQRTYTQKGTVTPGNRVSYSDTVTPGSPTQNTRFGSTEPPRRIMSDQRRPSTAVDKPQYIPGSDQTNYKYSKTGPVSEYPSSTVVPGYRPEGQSVYGNRISSGERGSTPQSYQTSTYGPTTVSSTTPGYQTSFSVPTGTTPGVYQPGSYQTGYQYEPVRTEYSTTRPQSPTSGPFIPGTSTPAYYQTTYEQGPGYTGSTAGPTGQPGTTLTPGYYQTKYEQGPGYTGTSARPTGQPGTFLPGTSPQSLPTGTYQNGYQYGPTTPNYANTVTSSTPGKDSGSRTPESYNSQTSPPGYVYGPSSVFPTTSSSSRIGTTPGTFIASTTPGQSTYPSTTQGPYPTQGTYNQNQIVDGFGRPIATEQPGYIYPGQEGSQYPGSQYIGVVKGPSGLHSGPNGLPIGSPVDTNRPVYGIDQSTTYPGYNNQPQVIGEDFSGPKQPQRFDPQTGYHYK
ncbi:uncharacterized protein LOC142979887 [Anticarsia gemmatalis]|uniref:uncharacterized protein LOC142979887 n=1 Tax=Anticarsia gemmatalis TaxID=129554 RepID=UPI003F76D7DE